MAEYIKREDALTALSKSGVTCNMRAYKIVAALPAADVTEMRCAEWKYFHKQNKAVCTNCSFERDLDSNFGRAVACPNCGALMKEDEHEAN